MEIQISGMFGINYVDTIGKNALYDMKSRAKVWNIHKKSIFLHVNIDLNKYDYIMENITSIFGLDADQTLLLYSLEYMITLDDVEESLKRDQKKGSIKREWLISWTNGINNLLHSMGVQKNVLTNKEEMSSLYNRIKGKYNQNAWKYMILLECTLFIPYFTLSSEKETIKKYKGLKPSKSNLKESVNNVSSILGTDSKYIDIFKKDYKSAIKKLTNHWMKVLFGSIAAAFALIAIVITFQYEIAPLLAPGLYGVAAVNSALATLGGGALAAGGLGIAGGELVVVGGGAILGTSLSSGVMALIGSSSDFTLSQLARLQVVLKEIIMGMQNDVNMIQKILLNQQDKINELRKEVIRLKADIEKNKNKIKNLEKSINYFERFMEANIKAA